jgi:hypothetical protein
MLRYGWGKLEIRGWRFEVRLFGEIALVPQMEDIEY